MTPPRIFHRLMSDQKGATAIEYGLIAALIALIVIGGLTNAGTALFTTMNKVANATNK